MSLPVAEEAEQVEEQVDKVKVERQCAYGGELACLRAVGESGHLLYLLRIPCRKADENDNTGKTYYPLHGTTLQEDIDNGTDDKSYQCHNQEVAHTRQVALGNIPVNSHCAEHGCRDDKCGEYRRMGVLQQYHRKHHTVKYGICVKQQSCSHGAELLQSPGKHHHKHNLGNKQAEVEPRV